MMLVDNGPHWTLKALQESPRLHVQITDDQRYLISSADDYNLYSISDARRVPTNDPFYTENHQFWQCQVKRSTGTQVAITRRHIDPTSAIRILIAQEGRSEFIKTGLESLVNSYGLTRYTLNWSDSQIIQFECTSRAPNTQAHDTGSLRCFDGKGQNLAWLIRDANPEHDADDYPKSCATIWFEEAAITENLVDVIITSLVSITDVQYPLRT